MESFLEIKPIWEDESLFEVRVTASNGHFSGAAKCYTNREILSSFAHSLKGYPKELGQEINFSTGERNDLSYFNLSFKSINGTGHLILRIKIAHIVKYSAKPTESFMSEFDLEVEPAAIDNFTNSLKNVCVAKIEGNSAKLIGKI